MIAQQAYEHTCIRSLCTRTYQSHDYGLCAIRVKGEGMHNHIQNLYTYANMHMYLCIFYIRDLYAGIQTHCRKLMHVLLADLWSHLWRFAADYSTWFGAICVIVWGPIGESSSCACWCVYSFICMVHTKRIHVHIYMHTYMHACMHRTSYMHTYINLSV